MSQQKADRKRLDGAEGPAESVAAASGRGSRMSQQRKVAAVLRLLRYKDLEIVSHEFGVTSTILSQWRDAFLDAGQAALGSKIASGKKLQSDSLKGRLEEALIERDLLREKVAILTANCPPKFGAVRTPDDKERADSAAEMRIRIARQTEILRRHYEVDRNPLYVWKSIRLFAEWQSWEPLPGG